MYAKRKLGALASVAAPVPPPGSAARATVTGMNEWGLIATPAARAAPAAAPDTLKKERRSRFASPRKSDSRSSM